MSKTCLLTVGSTQFPSLVSAFLSPRLISQLASSLNITTIYAQIGHSTLPEGFSIGEQTVGGVQVEVTRFANDLERRVGESDLVISHAGMFRRVVSGRLVIDSGCRLARGTTMLGAGSILSFLRPLSSSPSSSQTTSKQRRLILVPNDTLMDSHQSDLADEMGKKGWATICRNSQSVPLSLSLS